MATIYTTTFQLRRGLSSTWKKNNPILERGEPGFEIDKFRLKIGDGSTPWKELPYIGHITFASENDLINYIGDKVNTAAYPGQMATIVGADSVRLYCLDQNLDYHLVSASGDNKTIEAGSEGFALLNFAEALEGQVPYKDDKGLLAWKNIALRRDNDSNYARLNAVPEKGEVLLVDTLRSGLRVKCGDGITHYNDLEFSDELYIKGYYADDVFYKDVQRTQPLMMVTHKLYLDLNSNKIYYYNGVNYICTADSSTGPLPNASSKTAGILKLYETTGTNTDGTMTQAAITKELEEKFEIDVKAEEELIRFFRD